MNQIDYLFILSSIEIVQILFSEETIEAKEEVDLIFHFIVSIQEMAHASILIVKIGSDNIMYKIIITTIIYKIQSNIRVICNKTERKKHLIGY